MATSYPVCSNEGRLLNLPEFGKAKKIRDFIDKLGPVYMEKSCPGQEGHPPSRVNFTERLYEKKVDPIARAKS